METTHPKEEPDSISSATPAAVTNDQPQKSSSAKGWLALAVVVGGFLGVIWVPNFIRARAQGSMTACKTNLKNIGTACEMYSTDWAGKYPASLAQLTPNYLKTIPECPPAARVTYTLQTGPQVAYNSPGREDYYFICCEGENHTAISVPANYPQYDSVSGLIER
jgi:hypothetical protein